MSQESVYKITLSSGRVVILKEMKIKYQNLAMKIIGKQAGDNQILMASLLQQELLKQLLVEIDGVPYDQKSTAHIDDLFTFKEYSELSRVLQQVTGGEEGEVQTELVTTGNK